jgi:hypothetical protein
VYERDQEIMGGPFFITKAGFAADKKIGHGRVLAAHWALVYL